MLYLSYKIWQTCSRSIQNMLPELIVTSQRVSQMAWIVFPALSIVALLGVDWWGRSSSHKDLLWSARLSFSPGVLLLQSAYSSALDIFFHLTLGQVRSVQIEGQCELWSHSVLVILSSIPLSFSFTSLRHFFHWASISLSWSNFCKKRGGGGFCLLVPTFPTKSPELP